MLAARRVSYRHWRQWIGAQEGLNAAIECVGRSDKGKVSNAMMMSARKRPRNPRQFMGIPSIQSSVFAQRCINSAASVSAELQCSQLPSRYQRVSFYHVSTKFRKHHQGEKSDLRSISKSKETQDSSDQARWERWKQHWWQQLQTIPNCITLTRIACTPLLVHWIVNNQPIYAVAGCLAAGVSDYLDGWIAKNYNQGTVLGTYVDPLADKILINSLSVAVWCSGVLPTPIMGIWMTKDVVLMVATYRYVVAQTNMQNLSDEGTTATPVSRRMAFLEKLDPLTIPLKVEPTQTSKANTALQFVVLGMSIVHPLYSLDPYLSWLSWTSAGTTVLSLLSYIGYKGFAKSGNLRKEWENGNITRIVKESVQEKNPQKIASLLSKQKEEILKMPRSPIVLKKTERTK